MLTPPFHSTVTHQRALRDQLYHLLGAASCLIHFTVFFTLESMLLRNLLPPVLFGQASMLMSVVELAHVSQCQRAKINTLVLHYPHFPSLTPALMLSTLTLLDHFHPLKVILTFLPVWIDTPAGLRHYPSERLQQTLLPKPSSRDGSPILVFPLPLLLIMDANLNLPSGLSSCHF